MDLKIKTDKKDYFKCSMYYMRRYFGLREIILMSILFIAGMLLYFLADLILILIFFGLTCAVLLLTVVLFVWTSLAGCKHDLEKIGVAAQKLHFEENAVNVEFYDKGGELIVCENYEYSKIEAVVIKKRFIYIYAAIAIFFYIKRDKIGDKDFEALGEYLRENVPKEKFKFKTVKRIYPKKQKIKFEADSEKKE